MVSFKIGDTVECTPDSGLEACIRGRLAKVVKVYDTATYGDPVMYAVKLKGGKVPPGCAKDGDDTWLAYYYELALVRRAPGKPYQRVDAGPRYMG